jgi:hypothetical protein
MSTLTTHTKEIKAIENIFWRKEMKVIIFFYLLTKHGNTQKL